ncbi:MAG: biosynthetic arginine decarboxylase [Acidobacteriota bacterium]
MVQRIKLKDQTTLPKWSIEESRELYNIPEWGKGFFEINDKGNIVVLPEKNQKRSLDIKTLVDALTDRGISPPLLIRFTDILRKRIEELQGAFEKAIAEYGYKGRYFGVYPVKVNQNRQVVEDIVEFGREWNFGLEAGTKAELLIVLASLDNTSAPVVCNGYKDDEYVEMALWATKLGRKVFVVVEKPSELDLVLKWARRLRVKPFIGVRAKLSARGRGKWESSGGDKSKFGLFPAEILDAVEKLKAAGMADRLQLLHFHLGSQITSIQSIKEAMRESSRIFAELVRMGVPISYFDVGGGLAVDYDGSKTNFSSSANYSMEEYASDVVSALAEICAEQGIEHPHIISESGRALVAYHSVLVFNVLGSSELISEEVTLEIPEDAPESVANLAEVLKGLSVKNFQESYHDALQIRDETLTLFNVGMMSLNHRALVERLFWAICYKIAKIIHTLDYVPDELEHLDRFISDTYYGNLSVFQSLPDHWAVKQLFPICPIHRLRERPARKATIADITCDSDGKVDQFVDLHDVRNTIDLHPLEPGKPYYLGVFLVGAYQEALGDLHNLFGDTNTVHVSVTGRNKYRIDKTIEGDRVRDVLSYMQYQKRDIMNAIRASVEEGIEKRRISIKESARIKRFLEDGLEGYTYLE